MSEAKRAKLTPRCTLCISAGVVEVFHPKLLNPVTMTEHEAGMAIICHAELLAALKYATNAIVRVHQTGCPAGPVAVPSIITAAIHKAEGA